MALRTVEHDALTRTARKALGRAEMRVGCVGGHERLGLGGDGREHALLVETHAVAASAILRGIETGASNLGKKKKEYY